MRDRTTGDAPITIPRRTSDAHLPLSFGQQRLWFLNELEPDTFTYNDSHGVRLQGALDADALQHALGTIVQRHEVLRTCFVLVNGTPEQQIAPAKPFTLEFRDLSTRPAAVREVEAEATLAGFVRRPFDFGRDLFLRAALVRTSAEEHILVLLTHHIASDGWSQGRLFHELSECYRAFRSRSAATLPALPIQYADYALWQRQWLQGEELDRQVTYWRAKLTGAPTVELPTDRSRPAIQSYCGAKFCFRLPTAAAVQLAEFGHRESATPFMTLLAGFQVLLSRLTDQDNIVIGTPIANRQRVELENLIGFFVNTLVLRADLSSKPSFREFVRQVKSTALDAYSHQDVPFDKLVEELNPERDLSRHPLFQVMFVLQNTPSKPLRLEGLTASSFPVSTNSTPLDLELHLSPEGESYTGTFTYNTDLFDPETIEQFARHYQTLLQSLVVDPGRNVFEVPLLTAGEREQLVFEWNNTAVDYPAGACLHHLVEDQAEKTPDAIAVTFGADSLTHRQLNARANQLANRLHGLGLQRETPVAICLDRSLDMLVALLAVLKAGGTYVPIDPNFPPARVQLILGDCHAALLLAHERLRDVCADFEGKVVCLDGIDWKDDSDAFEVEVSPQDAAYIIYTSGSTGVPKGVVVEHRSVVNFLRSMRMSPGIRDEDVLVAVTSISFDISVLELFLPLTVGARVVIAPDASRGDPVQLAKLLTECKATILQATPATWSLLAQNDWKMTSLKALVGGERLPHELAHRILERCGELWNLYGPTETTVWSLITPVGPEQEAIIIGKPIANEQAYLVDRTGELVPVGVPGELLIGGAGLARGYLNRTELTAERFTRNPFAPGSGTRVYRTGDVCRYRRDGNLQFIGRRDQQLKVRGFRVEPCEIEAAMLKHSGIDRCVVVDWPDGSGDKRLVAYFTVTAGATEPNATLLRTSLKETLPEYMVPASFVRLDALPVSTAGKVNRKALPAPLDPGRIPTDQQAMPRNTIERQLAEIWQDLLQSRGVGRSDDFFALGGHSLMAVRLITEINKTFGTELPLVTVFRTPTIEGMASAVQTSDHLKLKSPGLIVPKTFATNRKIFWAPSIGVLERFVECHNLARLLKGRYDFIGFDPAPEFAEITDLARHCVTLIRTEQPEGPYEIAGYCQCGHVAYEIAAILQDEGEEVDLLAIIDCSARGMSPNFRQRLYRVRDGLRGNPTVVMRRVRNAVRRNGKHVQPGSDNMKPFLAHGDALARYKARKFKGRLSLFRSEESAAGLRHSPKLGWDALARIVDVHPVPCRHSDMLSDPAAAQLIAEALNRHCQGATTSGR
ncbi:MAG: non-ribosomal peptide synthetase [Chthoniobacterales bacterium]